MLERATTVTQEGAYTRVDYARYADDLVILVDWHRRHGPVAASAGRGGVRRGSRTRSGSLETTGSDIGSRPKGLLVDRSHNP
jgi:hypothetical protein